MNCNYMFYELKVIAAVAVFTILSGCERDPLALLDRDASRVIERIWRDDVTVLPLGQLASVGDPLGRTQPDTTKGEVSREFFKYLLGWAKVDVVKVSETQDLSKGFSGWDDFLALSQKGVQTRFVVAEGPKASQLRCGEDQLKKSSKVWGQTNRLCIPLGEGAVKNIVRNELHSIGTDHYRAIMGTHTWKLSPIMGEYYRKLGYKHTEDKKFIVALKHDPFTNEWSMVARDIADRNSEFGTDAVKILLDRK